MKSVFIKKENNKVYFDMEIQEDKFKDAVQKAYLKNRGRFNIPGFRKGKVPKNIIEMNYGEDIFFEDAINIILPEAYDNAIKELGLEPVDAPEVDVDLIEKGKPVTVKFQVEVKPEVKLGDYQSIELEKIEYNVTDEMIDAELKVAQDQNGRIIDAGDRAIVDGDILTIDFAGFVDDIQFPGGTAENQTLEIGSNSFITGFEDQLIGKTKGEEVVVNVNFPEEYHEESLAGKPAKFEVTIHDIKTKELPELDDEFAKDVSEFDTLEEYKASIRTRISEELAKEEKINTENRTLEKIIELAEVDIPEAMINSQIEDEVKDFEYRIKMQGLDLDKYLEIIGSDLQGLKEQLRPIATKRVNIDLVLEAIGKAENIEVSEEDIDVELEKLATQYKQDDKEKFFASMKSGDLGFLKAGIINGKVIDLLISRVKFN